MSSTLEALCFFLFWWHWTFPPGVGERTFETSSNPGIEMVYPEPCFKRVSAAICGWDYPLPTVIYPGFQDVAHLRFRNASRFDPNGEV